VKRSVKLTVGKNDREICENGVIRPVVDNGASGGTRTMFNSHGGTHNSALEPCALGTFKGNGTVCLVDDAQTGTELESILACSRTRIYNCVS
jgi:hypothetical protein